MRESIDINFKPESAGIDVIKTRPQGEAMRKMVIGAIENKGEFTIPDVVKIVSVFPNSVRTIVMNLLRTGQVRFLRSEKNSSGKKGSKVDIYEWISNGNLEKKS